MARLERGRVVIEFGDPCYRCSVRMTPASRVWCGDTIPAGMRKHAGNALCTSCAEIVRRDPKQLEIANA